MPPSSPRPSFRYCRYPTDYEGEKQLDLLVKTCGRGNTDCSGLPPTSCAAFGAAFQQRLDDPMQVPRRPMPSHMPSLPLPLSCPLPCLARALSPRRHDPAQCLECEDLLKIALLYALLVLLFLLAISFYIRLILRHPGALQRWVSTTALFFCHAQTLSLIGLLRLGWPKSAEAVTDTLGLHPGCTRCGIEL